MVAICLSEKGRDGGDRSHFRSRRRWQGGNGGALCGWRETDPFFEGFDLVGGRRRKLVTLHLLREAVNVAAAVDLPCFSLKPEGGIEKG
ncbi:unnamed protein product [Linum trigynum]|uniref:Uncharacterized protein n=1 Tax=Linum trigynum TaxID=586398 RepID=A0AAV2E7C0_9ROSI